MKRVLVTGATGALGRRVVERLRAWAACEIVCLSRRTSVVESGWIACDLLAEGAIEGVLDQVRPDAVLHLAASFSGDFDEANAINFLAASRILRWAESRMSPMRVLLAGSAAEYGEIAPDENPVAESRALHPVSIYGLTKACQSQLVSVFARRGVDVVCARIFNLIGEGISEKLFIGRLQVQLRELAAGVRQHLEFGVLSAARDYVSVDEAVEQILVVLQKGRAGEVYHVASGKPIIMRDLLKSELQRRGLDLSIVRESESLSNRSGYDASLIFADIRKTMCLMPQEQVDAPN